MQNKNPLVEHGGDTIHDIRSDVSALQQAHKSLSVTVEGLARKIDHLVDRMGDSMRTPWATLASWAAVIITIMVLSFAPVIQRQLSQEERIEALREKVILVQVQAVRDVAVNQTKIEFLTKEVDAKRESILLSTIASAEAKAEIEHLSEEIARLRDNLNETQLTLPSLSGAQSQY